MARKPSIEVYVKDVNSDTVSLTGDNRLLIRYHSSAFVTAYATAYDGASINNDMWIIRNGDETGYDSEYTFNHVESSEFIVSVEDSNGNVGTATYSASTIPYIELTCHAENNKPDASGYMRLECSGDYYNDTFGAKNNVLSVDYRYAKSGGTLGGWRNMTVTVSGNTYTAYADLSGLDYKESYTFEMRATDRLMSVTSSEAGVSSLPLFHWSRDEFVFEVPVKFNAGAEISDGGTGGDGGGDVECGLWTPQLDSGALDYYRERSGWYSRNGYVVTVGFYIKADCYSGYDDYDIVIYGLPFTPTNSASGGGICSGAFITGGKTFQCYVAEANLDEITVRVQDCDRDYGENIGTSASGCRYPEGGGTITLSGTITYMI